MEHAGVGAEEVDGNQILEAMFDQFFKDRPESEQRMNRGRLSDLRAFENHQFFPPCQPNVLSDTKDTINARLKKYGGLIQPPFGPVTIHFDFVDSTVSNGMTFVQDGVYFIGITSQMLVDFDKASVALARSPSVHDLLISDLTVQSVPPLCTALLVLQLQFAVFHELGHIFHGHRDARSFREEYSLSSMDKLRLMWPDQDLAQANEWLADRYALRMLLQDLIATESGSNMRTMIGSALVEDECILWLVLLSIGSVLFVGPSEQFHPPLIRKRDHPTDLARLNIIMRSIVEWAESKQRQDVAKWASSTRNSEWAMSCIGNAVPSDDRRADWLAQGEYLQTKPGQDYLDILYKENGVVTQDIMDRWWKL